MIHTLAFKLTEYFLAHAWIEDNNRFWCLYAIEKKLLQILFIIVTLFFAILSGQYLNVSIFMLTFYILRRRIGGWHAPYNALCIFLTATMLLAVIFWFGPFLMSTRASVLWALNIVVMLIGLVLPPIYPPQLNFDCQVIRANITKKNIVIVAIFFIQLFSFLMNFLQILTFSFLGVCASILLVCIEIIQNKLSGG